MPSWHEGHQGPTDTPGCLRTTATHGSVAPAYRLQHWGCIPLPCSLTTRGFTAFGTQEGFISSHPTWHMGVLKHKWILPTYGFCHVGCPCITVTAAVEGTALFQGWPVM